MPDPTARVVRASSALICSVRIRRPPTPGRWQPGPARFGFSQPAQAAAHDEAARRTYLEDGPAGILFGSDQAPTRWHLSEPMPTNLPVRVEAVELLMPPRWLSPDTGIAVVHVSLTGEPVAGLQDLVTIPAGPGPLRATLDRILPPGAALADGPQRAFSVSFVSFTAPPEFRMSPAYASWTADRQWLWGMASATTEDRYPPDPDDELLLRSLLKLSADWRALVLRDGAAFVGLRPHDPQRPSFLDLGQLLVHTVYTDVFILGFLQRQVMHSYANRLALELARDFDPALLSELEHDFIRVRTSLWWEKTTARGVGNTLLREFQLQNRLNELVAKVREDLSDSARLVQTESAGRQDVALGALSILGLPFGLVFAVGSVLGEGPMVTFVCLAVSLVTVALLHLARGVRELTRELTTQVVGRRAASADDRRCAP